MSEMFLCSGKWYARLIKQISGDAFNLMAPEKCAGKFSFIFKFILRIDTLSSSCELMHGWMAQYLTADSGNGFVPFRNETYYLIQGVYAHISHFDSMT